MDRIVLALAFVAFLLPLQARADQAALLKSVPSAREIAFDAFADGSKIGTHRVRFTQNGPQLIVETSIDFSASLLLVPVYRYTHRGREVWEGGRLLSVETQTDDDGEKLAVSATAQGNRFDVKGKSFAGLSTGTIAPTSYWAYTNLKVSEWMDTQTGKIVPMRLTPIGKEQIKVRGSQISARHYELDLGGDKVGLWYDELNRWVKIRFVYNGRTIHYELTSAVQ